MTMDWTGNSYELTSQLETRMGSHSDAQGEFSYGRRVTVDEEEEGYPALAFSALDALGLQGQYVPTAYGGSLDDFDRMFAAIRAVSRRDLTVSFLGAMPVWIGGNEAQKQHLAAWLLAKERISLALTEPDFGSDLLGATTNTVDDGDGYRVSGEKWLINGATRNSLVNVFARTDPAGGPRGFSLFLFDKAAAQAADFDTLPKVPTLGVRGNDISDIRFRQTRPPAAVPDGVYEALGEGLDAWYQAGVTPGVVPLRLAQ